MVRKNLILIGICIIAISVYAPSRIFSQEKKAQMKIAVVDINTIAEKYEKHNDKMEKLKTEVKTLEGELKKLDAKLRGLMERRELFDPDSEKYEEYTEEIEEIKIKGVIKQKTALKRLNLKQKKLVKTLYEDIRKAVGDYAKKNGYDLVMVELGELGIDPKTKIEEILNKINIRTVIYASEDLDITDKVIDYMNTSYRKEIGDKVKASEETKKDTKKKETTKKDEKKEDK